MTVNTVQARYEVARQLPLPLHGADERQRKLPLSGDGQSVQHVSATPCDRSNQQHEAD